MRRIIFIIGLVLMGIGILITGCGTSKLPTIRSSDGVQIAYHTVGEGDPALVFVHGWSCDKSYWKEQIPFFSEKYRVVTIDLAGHGDSGEDRTDWSIPAFGQDVASVIKALNLKRVILIGHSMGGPTIIEAAKLVPKRVIGLIGVDTFSNFELRYTNEQFKQLIAPFELDFYNATMAFVKSMFTTSTDSNLVNRIAEDMAKSPPAVGLGAFHALFQYDPIPTLESIKIPIIAINADRWPTNVEAGQRHSVSFSLKLMPGLGHFIMMEDPEKFNRLLLESVQEMNSTDIIQ
jgi:pimeloyl-ACP methyl ester carboxylesterase